MSEVLGIIIKFSTTTSNSAFLAFLLVHSIYLDYQLNTILQSCMEKDYAKYCQAQSFSPGSKILLCIDWYNW